MFLREVPSQILRNGAYRFAQARLRFQKGLGGAPQIRHKSGRQSVLLTSELFEFSGEYSYLHTRKIQRDLWLGTKQHPLGRLKFKAHRPYELPRSICVSVEPTGEWYVSFCYEKPPVEDELVLRTPEELAYEFARHPDLQKLTQGLDRGCVSPLVTSAGSVFALPAVNARRIARAERHTRRYQRRMARQKKGGKRRARSARRIARLKAYGREVRRDFAHKTSFALASSAPEIFVFEDLQKAARGLVGTSSAIHPLQSGRAEQARAHRPCRLFLPGMLGLRLHRCGQSAHSIGVSVYPMRVCGECRSQRGLRH